MGMVAANFRSSSLAVLLLFALQSLADVARQEAERRRRMDEQGIETKIIEGDPGLLAPNGNLTVFAPDHSAPKKSIKESASGKGQPSVRSYRNALQKLDRSIQRDEERLKARRARLQAEKWAPPKVGPISRSAGNADSLHRLQEEIEDLELRLKQQRKERSEVYDEGRKAGFLPGELDGKGLIP